MIPECCAVYAWRISLDIESPPEDVATLVNQLKRLADLPLGRVENVALSRALHLDGLTVGGAGLTPEKLSFFREYAGDPNQARWLMRFLRSIEQRTPVLYVGKAKDLSVRVSQHLSGDTSFGARVLQGSDFEWTDLKLEFLELGPVGSIDDKTLTALEQLYTVMSVASYTKRAG